MDMFVHRQNMLRLKKQLAETTDEPRRLQLLKLLAEEEEKNFTQPKEQ
jgi:hypothetical protein